MPQQVTGKRHPVAKNPNQRNTSQRNAPSPRKRKRANTGCLSGLLYFLFVVGISALLAGFAWIMTDEVLGLTKPDGEVRLEVKESDTIADITNMLKDKGLIQYPWLFQIYANLSHADEKIVPGAYTVATNLDYMAIVGTMKKDSQYRTEVQVVFPEGFTLKQIFARLAEKKVCSEEDLLETSRTHDFSYEYLKDLPKVENRLEGYLFPDTYKFYVDDDPVTVLGKMLANFDTKFTSNMRDWAEERNMTIHEVVTIASMIEREAANAEEAPIVSSVIHNRLNNPRDFPFLEIDATIFYALPEHKSKLTDADKLIDSPYNTYLYEGLPPGPIASPGKSSLEAALDPDETDYYYYALNKDGVHQFSKNWDEHSKVVAEAKAAEE